ncbi:hypothetical protein Cyrtocomes_00645 [Candidatus Cyrtobacter comes]|uniref:Uncharacterized protein n=1 Tax=Candidatus Cyrtobacter comes TaxID=675776 RepID=A0ABU5L817_9RICK|nr:hypothetical protein [Candidatus Cyrtobacter comes]
MLLGTNSAFASWGSTTERSTKNPYDRLSKFTNSIEFYTHEDGSKYAIGFNEYYKTALPYSEYNTFFECGTTDMVIVPSKRIFDFYTREEKKHLFPNIPIYSYSNTTCQNPNREQCVIEDAKKLYELVQKNSCVKCDNLGDGLDNSCETLIRDFKGLANYSSNTNNEIGAQNNSTSNGTNNENSQTDQSSVPTKEANADKIQPLFNTTTTVVNTITVPNESSDLPAATVSSGQKIIDKCYNKTCNKYSVFYESEYVADQRSATYEKTDSDHNAKQNDHKTHDPYSISYKNKDVADQYFANDEKTDPNNNAKQNDEKTCDQYSILYGNEDAADQPSATDKKKGSEKYDLQASQDPIHSPFAKFVPSGIIKAQYKNVIIGLGLSEIYKTVSCSLSLSNKNPIEVGLEYTYGADKAGSF